MTSHCRGHKMENLEKQIEGLIYISADEGISLDQLVSILEEEKDYILQALENLKNHHALSNSALELVDYGSKYHFITKTECFDNIAKFLNLNKIKQLSQSSLETLAIIAYKQPITRIEIEEIRGIGCEITLRKLMASDLVKEVGRLETPGRPILYGVSDLFLDTFQMVSLDELPELITQDTETQELF